MPHVQLVVFPEFFLTLRNRYGLTVQFCLLIAHHCPCDIFIFLAFVNACLWLEWLWNLPSPAQSVSLHRIALHLIPFCHWLYSVVMLEGDKERRQNHEKVENLWKKLAFEYGQIISIVWSPSLLNYMWKICVLLQPVSLLMLIQTHNWVFDLMEATVRCAESKWCSALIWNTAFCIFLWMEASELASSCPILILVFSEDRYTVWGCPMQF